MNYIIYGANSAIGSQLARTVLPTVDKLYLFYHQKTDKISDLFNHPKVVAIQSDIRDYNDLSDKLYPLSLTPEPLSAVYLPAIRSTDHKPLSQTSLELTGDIIEVNLKGAIHFLKEILCPVASSQKHDDDNPNRLSLSPYPSKRIVLLGSNVSRTGLKNGSVYSATKAALANLVRSVAMEEGKNGVLINIVSPGPVETGNTSYSDDYALFRKEYFEAQKQLTSLNKLASIEEVCSMIKYLTSAENTHITGEEIFITGGTL